MRGQKVLHSSSGKTYVTPDYVFKPLDDMFHFKLDAAASKDNAKCKKFYTKADDGLEQPWTPGPVWCNPPYGRNLSLWVEKGLYESRRRAVLVVMLLPSRTDTGWYRGFVSGEAFERPIAGRITFEGQEHGAPFPSFLAIWVPHLYPIQSDVWHFNEL